MLRKPSRFQLHVYIAALFLVLIVGFAIASITIQYLQAREMMLSASGVLFRHIGAEVSAAVAARYDTASFADDLLVHSSMTGAATLGERLTQLPLFVQALRDQPSLSAAYVGYDTGDFFLVRRLVVDSPFWRQLKPPPTAAFLLQSIEPNAGGPSVTRYLFFDDALQTIGQRDIPGEVMDPRARPWFAAALQSASVIVTPPYTFFTTREIGSSFARRSDDKHAVAGVDVTLASISDLLRGLRPTASAALALVGDNDYVLADSQASGDRLDAPPVAGPSDRKSGHNVALAALAGVKPDSSAQLVSINASGETWLGVVLPIVIPGGTLRLAVAAPESELLSDAIRMRNRGVLIALAIVLVSIPLTLACSRLASQPLAALTAEAADIQALKFDQPVRVRSSITEIDLLAQTMGAMKTTIRRFLEIGAALAGERQFDRLLQRLLAETMALARATGGAVYLSENEGVLHGALARWGDQTAPLPADLRADRDADHPVVSAAERGSLTYSLDAAELARWYPGFDGADDLTLLAIPLKNRQGIIVGVLTLLQDHDAHRDAEERDVMALVEAVAGTAATAIESQRLLLEQKRLLEALIELVAGAIDRKSAYTGGHCERVPALAEMLAHAAEVDTDGAFKDFALSADQWEELHIAGWLHDCGKVTTPEFVVDKATKLETIYDRLHEVRMRFEVLKREAEVACWRGIADGSPRPARLAELRLLWDQLDDEFAFVAECNVGGEFMAPERVERLNQIARRTWTRTLDDRIGLSYDEQRRKAAEPVPPLPIDEPLLANRPDHIIERRDEDRIAADNPWGFRVAVPQHLYNYGELYNLTIGRGTLTTEDRYKINEHIIETTRMLTRLPWPPHLSQVIEIACGHHEKMDGTGYPRRLKRDEMSVPARMMAIADIFEALTAADRPYKEGKTLSESLEIMARMRDEAHIDPDIFELFLSAGVYRTYAERFLRPEQIDQVDPAHYRAAA
jgi:HD-GYP domain-containing protein (c-di-GMP phosphodiesterase class II)